MERKTASEVPSDRAGSALAEYLAARFTYLCPEEWLRQIADGKISLNGEVADARAILAAGDAVAFDPSEIEEPEVDASYTVVKENEDFLVVDKSGSLPCHPSGRFFRHSLWFILRERYGAAYIATRLDRETSGLVLVCKNSEAARFAQGLLASGSLGKTYLAMIHGRFPDRLEARGFLIKDPCSVVRKKRRYVESVRPGDGTENETCETSFEIVGRAHSPVGDISLVRVRPKTGRMHQIRATLFSLGFPLVGDKLYGLDENLFLRFSKGGLDAEDLARLILPNQALHCAELAFNGADGSATVARSEPRWVSLYGDFGIQLPFRT
jgi:23S rRNA pseudouridine955/2504/2580 synthase/23S rRNA pseudouridine1911/1915/1917 synthase